MMGLWVPRLSQAQTGLPCPPPRLPVLPLCSGTRLPRGPGSSLAAAPTPPRGGGGASWELKPSSSSTFAAHRHSPAFPLASLLLATLLRAALGSGAHGRCPGIGRAVAGMTGDACCSMSASAWSLWSTGVRLRGTEGPPLRPAGAGAQSLMGGCPSLAREAVRGSGWGPVGRRANPLNCPGSILWGPRRQRLKCHCLRPGQGEGEVA